MHDGAGTARSRPEDATGCAWQRQRDGGLDLAMRWAKMCSIRQRLWFRSSIMPRISRAIALFLLGLLIAVSWPIWAADEQETLKVGLQPDGRVVVPTNQILNPAGLHVTFPGRPVDLALTPDGQTLVIK